MKKEEIKLFSGQVLSISVGSFVAGIICWFFELYFLTDVFFTFGGWVFVCSMLLFVWGDLKK